MTDQLLHVIAQQSWQIAVLAMIVAVMHRTFARNRPHLAHVLWMLVLIKSVTPPIWSHSFGIFSHLQSAWSVNQNVAKNHEDVRLTAIHYESVEPLKSSVVASNKSVPSTTDLEDVTTSHDPRVPENRSVVIAATSQQSTRSDWSFSWPVILLSLIGIGAATVMISMAVRCCLCLWQLQKHRTVEFDDVLREQLTDLARRLHVRRVPKIMVSDVLFGPAVFGFWRHVIVLPKCLIESGRSCKQERSPADEDVASGCEVPLSRKDLQFLEPILAHELLHIRRGDLRTGLVQALSQSLWWFHPAVWMCSRWLAREAERCCDEQVIAELGCSPAQYARCLLSVIESKHSLQPIPIFPGMKPVEITSQRMERIMSLKRDLKKQTPVWCWVTVILLAVVVLPGARPTSVNDEKTSAGAPLPVENSEGSIVTLLQPQKAGVPADGAGTSSVANSDRHVGSPLEAALRSRVSFNFQDVSLPEAIRTMAIDQCINITFRNSAFESLEDEVMVSFSCDDEPLGNALRQLVEPFGLRIDVDREIVVIKEDDDDGQHHSADNKSPEAIPGERQEARDLRMQEVQRKLAWARPPLAVFYNVADLVAPTEAGQQPPDVAPLMELIKATIAPTTWEQKPGNIMALPAMRSIVVVHRAEVHEEIRELLIQLRKDQDLVSIKAQLLRLDSAEQLKGIEKQCSLHSLNDQKRWALLTKERFDALSKYLAEQKCQVISRPQLTTLSGSAAAVEVGNDAAEVSNGFRLVVEPRAIADSRVIRLKHAVEIGRKMTLDEFAGADGFASLVKDELLIASGQTLLLVFEPEVAPTDRNAGQATARFVVLLTVERLQEAEADAADPEPASSSLNSRQ